MNMDFGKNIFVDIQEKPNPISNQILEKINLCSHDEKAVSIGDLGDIITKHKKWKECFPRVEPFYAVKCNDIYPVIRLLADMGLSFDCASKAEIQKILDLGVDPSRIVYANTFKQLSFIKYAADNGVTLMTFDSEDELTKIKKEYPQANLLLRISPQSNNKVIYHLGRKFGCHPLTALKLLQFAKKLELNVIGISFHVGSGCLEAGAFEAAIEQSRRVFDLGLSVGFNMNILDIGGGFPGQKNVQTNITFEKIATAVNLSLDKYFPGKNVRIIAEPGRYYVASAFTIATNIITKKIVMNEENELTKGGLHDHPTAQNENLRMYYVNEGIYGSFLTCMTDPGCYVPSHFKDSHEEVLYNSIIWGPTCAAVDLVIDKIKLPDLSTGDWIYFKDMGAYSFTTATNFNSMPRVEEYFTCEKKLWEQVYQL
ncbi:ornithine decarboxylase-like isoform X1 [Mytilus californianus]|uniref:ornithine decarboxylase-like isoform X1 n=1 Tax=Mytilus californianus TaxID=6549 RepID=UPI0022461EDD|nr:ornithine decarboxylase-like isoform X1 [Mytilus californianus]XP_052074505.1 ornithine decarboxylase-like isoform X2 [Mytilus californianus]XP_052074506.1 ornithine decarboxylase-like isoform X1 [Mytilus californianus]